MSMLSGSLAKFREGVPNGVSPNPLATLMDPQGPNPEKAMQLEKMRIVMDRSGIKRLEPCTDSALLAKAKRAPLPHLGHH